MIYRIFLRSGQGTPSHQGDFHTLAQAKSVAHALLPEYMRGYSVEIKRVQGVRSYHELTVIRDRNARLYYA